jgi:hypothetical protein
MLTVGDIARGLKIGRHGAQDVFAASTMPWSMKRLLGPGARTAP